MRSRRVSSSVSLPLCQMEDTDSAELENLVALKLKSEETIGPWKRLTSRAAVSHFCASVISNGQHDIAPLGPDFLPLTGTDGLPPEWWQSSLSAIRPAWLSLPAWFALDDACRFACKPASAGSAHPRTHDTTAIQKEIATAIPALTITLCRAGRILFGLYTFIVTNTWSAWSTLNMGTLNKPEKENGEKSKNEQPEDRTQPKITREQVKSAPSFIPRVGLRLERRRSLLQARNQLVRSFGCFDLRLGDDFSGRRVLAIQLAVCVVVRAQGRALERYASKHSA